jgi:hypothetical protein
MSFTTTFSNQRSGTTIQTGIACQLDDISIVVKAGSGGAIPYDSYMLISLFGCPDIRQGDLLVDENPLHVDTYGNQLQYRMSDNPEVFDDHLEGMIVLLRQKAP